MPSDVRTGTVLAGFRIESQIGEGAMGAVYVAEDTRHGGQVALKVLVRDLAEDERFRRRFLRESSLAASLDHSHVVPIVDAGEEDGVLYLAMELVEGLDLREVLRREGRLDPERAISLAAQVAEALDAAHAAGLVHRDVKPANILIREEADGEHAYVCDFGLARHLSSASSLTTDRGLVGTIDYIPPEQIEGGDIDGRADVYSLGCVLFECLAGARPFDRESELSVVFAHLNEPPPRLSDLRPELPAAFDDLFATALAKSPSERYSTCGELVEAAHAAVQGRTVVPRSRRRGRMVMAGIAVIVVAGAAIGGILTMRGGSDSTSPAITQTSIAGARLGLRRAAYEGILGRAVPVVQPPETPGAPSTGYPTLTFDESKVWVFFPDGFDATGEIIVTWNEELKTATGVGPCSTIEELKTAYGDKVRPDYFGTIGEKHFMYDVGKNLLFPVSGELSLPGEAPIPGKYVSAVGLFNGSAPGADESFGERPFAGFVTGNQTPSCVP
ncbi:MAG TPA: serine/threonine-protein kinase [Gaiellaceae bacterium]|nr:serine/threonine-protein kinase [Gaiellaceae bacterium]